MEVATDEPVTGPEEARAPPTAGEEARDDESAAEEEDEFEEETHTETQTEAPQQSVQVGSSCHLLKQRFPNFSGSRPTCKCCGILGTH